MYTCARTHTHPYCSRSHSHQNRSFAKGGLCRHPHTHHHRNGVWLLTLCWGDQDGHLWHFTLSSQVAKFVNWLKYFIWNQNFHLLSSSQEEKNLSYLHLFLFFSPRLPKISAKGVGKYLFSLLSRKSGENIFHDWLSSQFYHVAWTRACRMSSNTLLQCGQYELHEEGHWGSPDSWRGCRDLCGALNASAVIRTCAGLVSSPIVLGQVDYGCLNKQCE